MPKDEVVISFLGVLQPGLEVPIVVSTTDMDSAVGITSGAGNCPTFGDALERWRRTCGIPRPNSASRASVAAATVCRSISAVAGWGNARIGVVSASTTSAAWTAVMFESRGLSEGWHAVNPLLLPSTLPSALATQVAMAVGARAFAVACLIGSLAVFHALEVAILSLARHDADVVLVVVSDEQTLVQQSGHDLLGWLPTPSEFAGVLAVERWTRDGRRIAFLSYGVPTAPVPSGWRQAPRLESTTPYAGPSMQNGETFRVIARGLAGEHRRVVVSASVPEFGEATSGFESV